MTRIGIAGAGQFGRHHARVAAQSGRARLAAVMDIDAAQAAAVAGEYGCEALTDVAEFAAKVEAAIVATPTGAHEAVARELMARGVDVLVEKPIAPDLDAADRLVEAAEAYGRILQVGHLERFNPAVAALAAHAGFPLFFEIHRLSVFSPRSLDVDVVLDLMIHDIDIVLSLVKSEVEDIRAAGIAILSPKEDIANVRLQFGSGCVANLTASRISTEKVRKLRVFQPGEYISVDYSRQSALSIRVNERREVSFHPFPVVKAEPLQLQFEAFLDAVERRSQPLVDGRAARRSLAVAVAILDKIREHADLVAHSLVGQWKP
jgi:predicted dehydrogenase